MNWLQCFIRVSRTQLSTYEDALLALGASSVTYCDAADQPLFEPGPGEIALWEDVELVGLFTEDFSADDLREQLTKLFDDKLPPLRFEPLADQVWERAWMEHFQPMRFGKRLWIYPSGFDIPDDDCVALRLDPGLAFGTGTHPTTALCLEWLDAQKLQEKTIIDYGCGSGILAIAALLVGAASATGYDNDPQALTATHDNATNNHCAEKLQVKLVATEGETITRKADVVLANILAGPLRELAPRTAPLVVEDGHLVLSGILAEQRWKVIAAYNGAGLKHRRTTWMNGWVTIELVR